MRATYTDERGKPVRKPIIIDPTPNPTPKETRP
jgi:hypothetical protein